MCEPSVSIKFDLVCDKTLFDESRSGNNGKMIGQTTLSSKFPFFDNNFRLGRNLFSLLECTRVFFDWNRSAFCLFTRTWHFPETVNEALKDLENLKLKHALGILSTWYWQFQPFKSYPTMKNTWLMDVSKETNFYFLQTLLNFTRKQQCDILYFSF